MKRSTKMNLIFIAVVLAAAGLIAGLRGMKPAGNLAVVTYGIDQKQVEIPLNKDGRHNLDSMGYTVHLEVKDGAIRFVDSPCPDHLCENYGWLSQTGDFAACMPALTSVVVQAPA